MLTLKNVWYLNGVFDAVERGANGAFGVPMKAQQ